MVKQITGCILTARIRVDDMAVRAVGKRSQVNALLGIAGVIGREKQEVLAIGQKMRPAMGRVFAPFKLSQARRSASGGADSPQGFTIVRLVDNDIVLIPGPSSRVRSFRENSDWSPGGRHFLQMAVGKEANEFGVGGPERKDRTIRAIELLCLQFGERLHPDRVALFLVSGAERHHRSVSR